MNKTRKTETDLENLYYTLSKENYLRIWDDLLKTPEVRKLEKTIKDSNDLEAAKKLINV